MELRRLAQSNNATSSTSSPRRGTSSTSPGSLLSTPNRGGHVPTTPRTRLIYPHSPVTSPSISASTPFDWDAARSRRPPPYATPVSKRVRGLRQSDIGTPTPGSAGSDPPATKKKERVVRKRGLVDRITSLPSAIAFELSLFPHNVPLPAPTTTAWLFGGSAHVLHFLLRLSRGSKVPESDLGWEDMYHEGEGESWFNWTFLAYTILLGAAILNALYLFTRTRLYQLTLATDPVSSPHADFILRPRTVQISSEDEQSSLRPNRIGPLLLSLVSHLWRAFLVSLRFLLNLSPPKTREKVIRANRNVERIQQLEVWTPGPLESALFVIYSPVHAVLWMAVTSANWVLICCIMAGVSVQLRALTRAYEALLKDRSIIAAEVMHEYDEKFVYPRVNPIRKDAAVMTHQAELVWDGH
ncbi:uncharacterized protein FIBRA_02161 [Fibroporia radiculosa]|uniref:Nuclear rim protein 1 n=1 Tax=Fibroporia radiculosa TaxID=599839 RepID=J4H1P5_9APHY|nr:uncharacterized protein FIBRA_02161 [Fibroporia radiculosa]CCM00134.1 predicted protein [Fibroporia radiculosa]